MENSKGSDAVLFIFSLTFSLFDLLHTLSIIVLGPSVGSSNYSLFSLASARMPPYIFEPCLEPKDLGTWGRRRTLGQVQKCPGVNRVEVARTEVYRKWLESVDKSLCSPVRTVVTMEAPMNMRIVPVASSANETNSPPRGCPFPLQ